MDWMSMRDYLLILLLIDTGLRISEAVSVKLQDFDLKEGTLKVRGKGNKERIVILSNRVMAAIKEYLKLVDTLKFNGTVPPGICYRGFNLSKIAKDLGICLGSSLAAVHYNSIDSKIRKKIQDYVEEKVKPVPLKYLFFQPSGETRDAARFQDRPGLRGDGPG